MSGHSKWANIKHRKAATDKKRGKVFTRIAKEIIISAKIGGGDPAGNPRLRLAIQAARSVNMSSDTIKKGIQRGTGELEGISYEEITFEGYGASGVMIVVETATDNRKRTIAEVRAAFAKYGGNLGETNSVSWNFDYFGVLEMLTNSKSEEELLEVTIEIGADDCLVDEDITHFICAPDQLAQCEQALSSLGFVVELAKFQYFPKTSIKIDSEESRKLIEKLLDTFDDHDDVQNVYTNYEFED